MAKQRGRSVRAAVFVGLIAAAVASAGAAGIEAARSGGAELMGGADPALAKLPNTASKRQLAKIPSTQHKAGGLAKTSLGSDGL